MTFMRRIGLSVAAALTALSLASTVSAKPTSGDGQPLRLVTEVQLAQGAGEVKLVKFDFEFDLSLIGESIKSLDGIEGAELKIEGRTVGSRGKGKPKGKIPTDLGDGITVKPGKPVRLELLLIGLTATAEGPPGDGDLRVRQSVSVTASLSEEDREQMLEAAKETWTDERRMFEALWEQVGKSKKKGDEGTYKFSDPVVSSTGVKISMDREATFDLEISD